MITISQLLVLMLATITPSKAEVTNGDKTGTRPWVLNVKSSQTQQKMGPTSLGSNLSGGHGGRTRNPCGQLISNQPASHSLILQLIANV